MSYVVNMVATAEKPSLTFVIPLKDEQATLATLGLASSIERFLETLQLDVPNTLINRGRVALGVKASR
jgi:hypothetical protein